MDLPSPLEQRGSFPLQYMIKKKKKSLHETARKKPATLLPKRAYCLRAKCLFLWHINHLLSKLLLKCIYARQDKSPFITPETFLPIREFQKFIHVYSADITPLVTLLMHLLPTKLTQYKEFCFPGKSPLKPQRNCPSAFAFTVLEEYERENTRFRRMQKYCC